MTIRQKNNLSVLHFPPGLAAIALDLGEVLSFNHSAFSIFGQSNASIVIQFNCSAKVLKQTLDNKNLNVFLRRLLLER